MWPLTASQHRGWTGRGLRAALASLLLPGVGQLLLGRRRKGAALITAALAVAVFAGWLANRGATTVAGWVLRPDVLRWLIGANLVLLVFRLYATFDAYADGAGRATVGVPPQRGWNRAGITVVVLLLAAAVATPHAFVGYYVTSTRDLLASVFIEGAPAGEPMLPTQAVPPPATARTPPESDPREPPPDPTGEPPEPSPNPWTEAGRVTVALLGSDAGAGRSGDRIDTLLVASVDTATGDTALFSVDRYIADFPLPARIADIYTEHCLHGDGWEYINALYRCGHERIPEAFAEAYPQATDPAAAAVADVLGELLGIDVPHYAMVDMAGFVAGVDALGGVEVDLASRLLVRISPPEGEDWYTVDLPAGPQTLDGEQALAFARMRESDGGDADRMRRQRCLLSNVSRTADIGKILHNFPTLAAVIQDHVTTSIPIGLLPDLIELVPTVDTDRIITVGFGTPDYRGWDHRPDTQRIQERVDQVLNEPDITSDKADTTETSDAVCH